MLMLTMRSVDIEEMTVAGTSIGAPGKAAGLPEYYLFSRACQLFTNRHYVRPSTVEYAGRRKG